MKSCEGAPKLERKTVEKNRRMHMKNLCFKLSSLIPKDHHSFTKDTMIQHDQLDHAASYINHLKDRIERLKRKRDAGMMISKGTDEEMGLGFRLPMIEVRCLDSSLEVVLIGGLKMRHVFHEVISILEEEGAEVVNASFSVVGDKIFYIIHSQLMVCPRNRLEALEVSQMLKEMIHGVCTGASRSREREEEGAMSAESTGVNTL